MNIFKQLSLLKSSLTSGSRYQFLIVILFKYLQSIYRRIILSAFGIKRMGTLAGNLLGLIQPLLKILSKYSCRIYNSFCKRLQIGIYSSIWLFFKLIIWLYLKFYSRILASSLKKILVYFLYTSGKLGPLKVKVTII